MYKIITITTAITTIVIVVVVIIIKLARSWGICSSLPFHFWQSLQRQHVNCASAASIFGIAAAGSSEM
jgi:hypothetical protein